MLTKKSFSTLACEYGEYVYENFLNKSYGLNSCSPEGTWEDKEDYQLSLILLKSGYKTYADLANQNVDLSILSQIKGYNKFYNIYNNTYITNNYTNIESTGFVYTQTVPAITWTVLNQLPFCPNVSIVDPNGQKISGQVTYSTNCVSITITFNTAMSGKAYFS